MKITQAQYDQMRRMMEQNNPDDVEMLNDQEYYQIDKTATDVICYYDNPYGDSDIYVLITPEGKKIFSGPEERQEDTDYDEVDVFL